MVAKDLNMDFFYGFDNNVKKYGISKGSKILINSLGLRVKVNLKNFPLKAPVLVYSNHPTGLDPFLLASIFNRNDFLFLGDIYHTKKGKSISKFVAPIVSSTFLRDFFHRRPTNWPGFINMRIKSPPVGKLEAKKINKKAIDQIAKHVKNGHLSLIFPSGGEYEFLPWKKGIYKIVEELESQKIKYSLYKIKIKNFSEFKLILHFLTFKMAFSNLEIEGYNVKSIIK